MSDRGLVMKNLVGDKSLAALAGAYLAATLERKAAEKEERETKGLILARLGGVRLARLAGYILKLKAVPPTPDRVITPDMLGQVIKGRAGYDLLEITPVEPEPRRARAEAANDDGLAGAAA